MDRLIELGALFDYYGMLLTERQRALVRQYAYENLTLAEIAEREGISRQGVRDGIVHAEQQLHLLESTLHLLQRTRQTRSALQTLLELVQSSGLAADQAAAMTAQIGALAELWEDDDGV